jgi:putative membrane protein
MTVYDLPAVNATLNALSAVLLTFGWFFIRNGRQRAHIACMACALVTSSVFLTCYLYYHAHVGSVRFTHSGPVRMIYFAILLTHTAAAIICLPMVIMTTIPALRRRFDRHKPIARWTLPVWLYVSCTGVIVYLMLYHLFPATEVLERRAARTAQVEIGR